MSDWLTIRVILEGAGDTTLAEAPGRIFLAHADHTFADLAETIDLSFGRWDLSHLHQFSVEGRELVYGGGDDPESEDSDEVTLGEAALRGGDRFTYVFDLGEQWRHTCTVDALEVDPEEEYGEEPDTPVALFGWGSIPDQYWRVSEDDSEDDDQDTDERSWGGPEAWVAVRRAASETGGFEVDPDALAAVTSTLRAHQDDRGWPYGVLLAAAALDVEELPEDDEILWIEVASGVVNPAEDLPVPDTEESALTAIEPADWAALVIELLRSDEAASDAPAMLELLERCPEFQQELSPVDEHALLRGLDLVRRLLETLGALDAEGRLTALGRWGLPRALERGLLVD